MIFILFLILLIASIIFIIAIQKYFVTISDEEKNEICKLLDSKKEIIEYDIDSFLNKETKIDSIMYAKNLFIEGIIPYADYSETNAYIKYKINDKYCSSANILLQLKINDNLEDAFYKDIFQGQVYSIETKTNITNSIKIISNEKMDIFNNTLKNKNDIKIETESIDLSQNYDIYTSDYINTLKYLSPQKIEILNKLERTYDFVNILIEENQIIIVIKTNKMYFQKGNDFINDFFEIRNTLEDLLEL